MRDALVAAIDGLRKYKRLLVPSGEAVFFALILFLSFWLRFAGIERIPFSQVVLLITIIIPLKIVIFWMFKLYHMSFRFISIYEITDVFKASAISTLILGLVSILLRDIPIMDGFPRSVIFIDFMLTFIVSSVLRFSFRFIYFPKMKEKDGIKVLVVGAGSSGEQLVREMLTSSVFKYLPVAFLDDDEGKQGSVIHNVRVLGRTEEIPDIVRKLGVEEIIISIPSASAGEIKRIMEHVRKAGISRVKILPGLFHIVRGNAALSAVRDLLPEDLLGREPARIDFEKIVSCLCGKRILVTGAGGSIGTELCRQLASVRPSLLIMTDIGETELFYIDREIKATFPEVAIIPIIADVKDRISMHTIFVKYSPQVVFHAAAYKHVPLMESNIREAVLNNIEGTRVTALLSLEYNVEKFIFISTDKAIKPTSIMGATKRASETLIRGMNDKQCKFVSVRFGNVLASRGSVVPIFKEQIKKGGPITITHPDMKRYLMSITEATELVLQASAMGEGGEVFVLDMGEPVKILDLAHELIRFYGLEPDKDIPIVFTGIRPGEKMFEELLTSEEGTAATRHEKIFIASSSGEAIPEYATKVEELINVARNGIDNGRIVCLIKELVPTYTPDEDLGECK